MDFELVWTILVTFPRQTAVFYRCDPPVQISTLLPNPSLMHFSTVTPSSRVLFPSFFFSPGSLHKHFFFPPAPLVIFASLHEATFVSLVMPLVSCLCFFSIQSLPLLGHAELWCGAKPIGIMFNCRKCQGWRK